MMTTYSPAQKQLIRQAAREEAIRRGLISPKRDFEQEPVILHEDGKTYPLHEYQREAWHSKRRWIAIFAGNQSGKTVLAPWWLLREMQRCGPGDYGVIGPDHPMLRNKARPELEKAMAGMYHSSGDEWILNAAGELALWGERQQTQTRILFRHGKAPDAIEAFTVKALWIEEPGQIPNTVWTAIKPRVMTLRARVLMTGRPMRWNWYVTEMWQAVMSKVGLKRKPDADETTEVICYPSSANPMADLDFLAKEKARLPDHEYQMRYMGIPTRPAGLVYDCFNASNIAPLSVLPNGKVPREWQLYIGFDFGLVNTAAVIIAEELKLGWDGEWDRDDPTGQFYLVGTYHAGEAKPSKEHLRCVHEICDAVTEGGKSRRPIAYGGAHGESSQREAFALSGLGIAEPPINNVDAQIELVYSAFKAGRLIVIDTNTKMIGEIEQFSYELDDAGEPTEKYENEAKYHRLAGLRYIGTRLFRGLERGKGAKLRMGVKND